MIHQSLVMKEDIAICRCVLRPVHCSVMVATYTLNSIFFTNLSGSRASLFCWRNTYMPLFNMKPANPDTVNTAFVKGLRVIGRANQYYLVMTAGMQIYKITVNIILQLLIWELKSYLFSAACNSSWILYPVFAHSCLVVVRRVYYVKCWGRWISCWRERSTPRIYVHSAS